MKAPTCCGVCILTKYTRVGAISQHGSCSSDSFTCSQMGACTPPGPTAWPWSHFFWLTLCAGMTATLLVLHAGFFVLQLFVSVTIEKVGHGAPCVRRCPAQPVAQQQCYAKISCLLWFKPDVFCATADMSYLQFSEMHQQQGKSALLTPQQEDWLRIERMMADIDLQVSSTLSTMGGHPDRPWWWYTTADVVASSQVGPNGAGAGLPDQTNTCSEGLDPASPVACLATVLVPPLQC